MDFEVKWENTENLNISNFMVFGIYRCLPLEIKFQWNVCKFWFDWEMTKVATVVFIVAPPSLFKEAVSIALRVRTFCIPGLRWHQTPSPTKPQSLYISFFCFVYVSLTLFPWRSSSSIEFSPTKVRLVAWSSSPGQDLDTVHGERGRGGGRMVGR